MARPLWLMALFFLLVACTPGEDPISDGEITDSDIDLDEVINFPDPHLLACVKSHAYISAEKPVRIKDVKNLTFLECISCGITDLTGLEKMPWVMELDFNGNPITSLEPLRNSIDLELLDVGGGGVSTLEPLTGCTKMKSLNVSGEGNIQDISPIGNMSVLEKLYLSGNGIEDISEISRHAGLVTLFISHTKVKNIDALKALLSLKLLDVRGACITDFSPIEYLKENGNLKTIYGATAEEQDYARCQ